MLNKKIFSAFMALALVVPSVNAAYEEVNCSTDTVFEQNSCDQCFNGGSKGAGANIGFLSDKWTNTGDKASILFKDEQDNPEMISLNGAVWDQLPSSDDFWEYPASMEAKYNDIESGYILKPGESVDWIQSKLGAAYKLTQNTAAKGENIGLLVYPITTHLISADDTIEVDSNTYKECVLFKSAAPEAPAKKLPQTGPESILLLLIAMLLGFGLLKITKKV